MRTIKMLGLAVTAALMAMALVGVSSAMAEKDTTLCILDELPCGSAHLVSHIHEATLPDPENRARLLTSFGTIRCHVLFLGDVLTPGLLSFAPEPLLISGNLTFTECNFGCTKVEINGPAHISVLKISHELARVTFRYEVLLNCPILGIHCIYNGEGLVGHYLGPLLASEPNGEMRIEEQVLQRLPGLTGCPETTKLDLLTTPLPNPIYVSS